MRLATQDFRYAVRVLRARPAFTAAVVATLALGIGASTAMFSVVDTALLRGLPFADPDRLVVLWGLAGPERDIRGASLPEARDWGALNRTLERVSVYDETSLTLRTGDGAERVEAEMVSADYFPLLGARAALGRTFRPEEDAAPDAHPVVVVGHALWTRRLGGDAGIVGRSIVLNDRPFTVVGVMPERFRGVSFDTEVWFPSAMVSATNSPTVRDDRGSRWLMVVGRLKPGVAMADAQRDLDGVAARLAADYPDNNTGRGVRVMSLRENYLGSTEALLRTLFGAVLVFLLITCANVTSLQLVRAASRQRELAVRLALGADRGRLVRQLLVEGVVLAAAGGVAGALLAVWGVAAARRWLPDGLLPPYVGIGVDGRALAFGLGLAVGVGVLCALVPAIMSSRQDLAETLKEGARSAASSLGRIRRPGPQQLLVVAEVALAIVLLAGAGLMMRSLERQLAVAPGFRPDGVLAARVSLPAQRYAPEQRAAFVEQLAERLAGIPSVARATVGSDLPFSGNNNAAMLRVEGGDEEGMRYYRHVVTPSFFETLGIPIVRGRGFTAADRRGAPAVVIVSEAMAKRVWPSRDPIGQRVRLGPSADAVAAVVGVAASARFRSLATNLSAPGSEPDVYFPFGQRTDRDLEIALRSRGDALPSAADLRAAVAAVDPLLAVYAVRPLADGLRQQSATARFGSLVLGAFSAVAVLLAAVGVYGVIAFVVSLSRREIAIRMALGATRGRVATLIVRNGLTLAAAGLALGLLASSFATQALASQLFGVRVTDPLTFSLVAGVVVLVAALASYLPAHRAAKVDPQLALKAE